MVHGRGGRVLYIKVGSFWIWRCILPQHLSPLLAGETADAARPIYRLKSIGV